MSPTTVSLLVLLVVVILYYEYRIKEYKELIVVYDNLAKVVRKVVEKHEPKP